ncbi:unannotated protein [freshwater metagenome]|uniref:Unannotated protein n=1 Tax=freshwater metagenome TaxID=449393 RepID=A0A6J7G1N7_9ZZZZ|nr:TetR family transcriptional regulator [Actinomycetota bacterium]
MSDAPATRRERLRLQTLEEIKRHALAQIAEGGTGALSLNAIGKAMGMSGPAIYRYFPSRDAVLEALVTDGYAALTAALESAAAAATRRAPARRVEALGVAYRDWAVAQPHLYGMLFGLRPTGYRDPDEAIAAVNGSMVVLLQAIGAVVGDREAPAPADHLDRELARWSAARGYGPEVDPRTLRLGVLAWTRLHGVVGLELAGVLADMELDPVLLIEAEVRSIVAAAGGS